MRRKALLSVILSAVMILGSVSPAFAAGEMPSDEMAVSSEASAPESQGDVVIEDESTVDSEQESVDGHETVEEEIGTETESEEDGIGQEDSDEERKTSEVEDPANNSNTDSTEEEEEKPEALVGAEGDRVSVGDNVTAGFDSETGTLTFYSQGGTLSHDWYQELGIDVTTIKTITISDDSDVMSLPEDSSYLFSDSSSANNHFSALQLLDLSKADTSNVTDMSGMFLGCCSLFELYVSGFETSNVTDMSGMFFLCSRIDTLDLSGFDTSNVTDMSAMFGGCDSLQTLDISGFDTSNVTNMTEMFFSCGCLRTLALSGFDTSNVTDMSGMFYNCNELQTLVLSGLDTSHVTGMSEMFKNCSCLQTLDVSGFDTSHVYTMSYMFKGCFSLQRLDISSFDMDRVTDASSMLPDDSLLHVIMTPVNVQGTITLPYTFVDTSGTEYDTLPQGVSESICLTKQGADIPDENIDIANATVTDIENKTYNGASQTQNLTVKLGDKTLTEGTDYTLSYENNGNAGTATVTVTGIGEYSGAVSKTFTIYKATPTLKFASTSISKTTEDVAFTNTLRKITDGVVRFKSSNTRVATVNSTSGKVTIKGAGTTTITAAATAGPNIKAGNAQYTLTVTPVLNIISISDDYYGKNGTPASFHVEAAGTGNMSYQWQYRTAGMADWKAPAQASAQTADYSFKLKPSYDNIEVRCIVSDDSGNEVISETRKANVFAFTSQPKDVIASTGEVVNFEVSAIGNNVTYQWYYKRPGSTWKKTTKAGSKTAVLPITASTVNDSTSYRCVITDAAGNKINSAAALLTLDNTSLQVTGISEDAYDVNGQSVTFHIDAAGNGDLTYQWQYRLAGESKWRTPAQANAKTADYVFKLRPSYDNIEVRCIVSDASGNSVTSDVRKANVFAITGQPEDAELELGEQTTFAVEAVGKDLAYQWFYMRPEGSWKKVTVAGANTANLVITANTKNDGTKFQCRITDGLGNMLISAAALLTQS